MTTEGSSFYSPEWQPPAEKKRKVAGEEDGSNKKPKPNTEAKPKTEPKKKVNKVVVDSDDDSKSDAE